MLLYSIKVSSIIIAQGSFDGLSPDAESWVTCLWVNKINKAKVAHRLEFKIGTSYKYLTKADKLKTSGNPKLSGTINLLFLLIF